MEYMDDNNSRVNIVERIRSLGEASRVPDICEIEFVVFQGDTKLKKFVYDILSKHHSEKNLILIKNKEIEIPEVFVMLFNTCVVDLSRFTDTDWFGGKGEAFIFDEDGVAMKQINYLGVFQTKRYKYKSIITILKMILVSSINDGSFIQEFVKGKLTFPPNRLLGQFRNMLTAFSIGITYEFLVLEASILYHVCEYLAISDILEEITDKQLKPAEPFSKELDQYLIREDMKEFFDEFRMIHDLSFPDACTYDIGHGTLADGNHVEVVTLKNGRDYEIYTENKGIEVSEVIQIKSKSDFKNEEEEEEYEEYEEYEEEEQIWSDSGKPVKTQTSSSTCTIKKKEYFFEKEKHEFYYQPDENDKNTKVFSLLVPLNFAFSFLEIGGGFCISKNPFFNQGEHLVYFKGKIVTQANIKRDILFQGHGYLAFIERHVVNEFYGNQMGYERYDQGDESTMLIFENKVVGLVVKRVDAFEGGFCMVGSRTTQAARTTRTTRAARTTHHVMYWKGEILTDLLEFIPGPENYLFLRLPLTLKETGNIEGLKSLSKCLAHVKEKVFFYDRITYPDARFTSFSLCYQKFLLNLLFMNDVEESVFSQIPIDVLKHKIIPFLYEYDVIFKSMRKLILKINKVNFLDGYHCHDDCHDDCWSRIQYHDIVALKEDLFPRFDDYSNPWKMLESITFLSHFVQDKEIRGNLQITVREGGRYLDFGPCIPQMLHHVFQKTKMKDDYVHRDLRRKMMRLLCECREKLSGNINTRFGLYELNMEPLYPELVYVLDNMTKEPHLRSISKDLFHCFYFLLVEEIQFLLSTVDITDVRIELVVRLLLQRDPENDGGYMLETVKHSGLKEVFDVIEQYIYNNLSIKVSTVINIPERNLRKGDLDFAERLSLIIKSLQIIFSVTLKDLEKRKKYIMKKKQIFDEQHQQPWAYQLETVGMIGDEVKNRARRIDDKKVQIAEELLSRIQFLVSKLLKEYQQKAVHQQNPVIKVMFEDPDQTQQETQTTPFMHPGSVSEGRSFVSFVDALLKYLPDEKYPQMMEPIFLSFNRLLEIHSNEKDAIFSYKELPPYINKFLKRIEEVRGKSTEVDEIYTSLREVKLEMMEHLLFFFDTDPESTRSLTKVGLENCVFYSTEGQSLTTISRRRQRRRIFSILGIFSLLLPSLVQQQQESSSQLRKKTIVLRKICVLVRNFSKLDLYEDLLGIEDGSHVLHESSSVYNLINRLYKDDRSMGLERFTKGVCLENFKMAHSFLDVLKLENNQQLFIDKLFHEIESRIITDGGSGSSKKKNLLFHSFFKLVALFFFLMRKSNDPKIEFSNSIFLLGKNIQRFTSLLLKLSNFVLDDTLRRDQVLQIFEFCSNVEHVGGSGLLFDDKFIVEYRKKYVEIIEKEYIAIENEEESSRVDVVELKHFLTIPLYVLSVHPSFPCPSLCCTFLAMGCIGEYSWDTTTFSQFVNEFFEKLRWKVWPMALPILVSVFSNWLTDPKYSHTIDVIISLLDHPVHGLIIRENIGIEDGHKLLSSMQSWYCAKKSSFLMTGKEKNMMKIISGFYYDESREDRSEIIKLSSSWEFASKLLREIQRIDDFDDTPLEKDMDGGIWEGLQNMKSAEDVVTQKKDDKKKVEFIRILTILLRVNPALFLDDENSPNLERTLEKIKYVDPFVPFFVKSTETENSVGMMQIQIRQFFLVLVKAVYLRNKNKEDLEKLVKSRSFLATNAMKIRSVNRSILKFLGSKDLILAAFRWYDKQEQMEKGHLQQQQQQEEEEDKNSDQKSTRTVGPTSTSRRRRRMVKKAGPRSTSDNQFQEFAFDLNHTNTEEDFQFSFFGSDAEYTGNSARAKKAEGCEEQPGTEDSIGSENHDDDDESSQGSGGGKKKVDDVFFFS